MLICDKCGAGINEGSKFCPQCGDPVTDADRVTVPVAESQVANVEISFGESSSANFTKAVEICKNIPSYSVTGEGKQAQHKLSLPITVLVVTEIGKKHISQNSFALVKKSMKPIFGVVKD
jgi:hypothetical protein